LDSPSGRDREKISLCCHDNEADVAEFHRGNVTCRALDTMYSGNAARNRRGAVAVVPQSASPDAFHRNGAAMSQASYASREQPPRATGTLIFTASVLLAAVLGASGACAQSLGYAPASANLFATEDGSLVAPPQPQPPPDTSEQGDRPASVVPARLRRATVNYSIQEPPGTVIIDTANTALYYLLGQNRAIRYGVGVGREGFTWSGVQTISRKAEWPDWHPPAEMIARQPYLPRFMAGGPGNPLGARAMYLGGTAYRIHGTNDPSTIGKFVSSGCIRLTNEDVVDLFGRVDIGTKVVVLPKNGTPRFEAHGTMAPRPVSTAPAPRADRQAMNHSPASIY